MTGWIPPPDRNVTFGERAGRRWNAWRGPRRTCALPARYLGRHTHQGAAALPRCFPSNAATLDDDAARARTAALPRQPAYWLALVTEEVSRTVLPGWFPSRSTRSSTRPALRAIGPWSSAAPLTFAVGGREAISARAAAPRSPALPRATPPGSRPPRRQVEGRGEQRPRRGDEGRRDERRGAAEQRDRQVEPDAECSATRTSISNISASAVGAGPTTTPTVPAGTRCPG